MVISIIALLVGLLLPALGAARGSARSIRCASNMRQLATGYTVYAHDNKGIGVPGRMPKMNPSSGHPDNYYNVGNGMQYRPRWFVAMGASAGFHAYQQPSGLGNSAMDNSAVVDGSEVFICPEVPDRINNRNYAYGYNFQFLGNSRQYVAGRFVNFPVRADALQGSATVLAGDSLGTAAHFGRDARTSYQVGGNGVLTAVSNHGWALDPPRLTATSDTCDDGNVGVRSGPDARHADAANFSFIDGHVETKKPMEMGYSVNGDGSFAASAGAENTWFSGTARDDDPPPIN